MSSGFPMLNQEQKSNENSSERRSSLQPPISNANSNQSLKNAHSASYMQYINVLQ